MSYKTAAIARLIVLVILVINQSLISFGMSPLPFDDEEVEAGVNAVLLAIVAIISWWKNNNVTVEAQQAQRQLDRKKGVK